MDQRSTERLSGGAIVTRALVAQGVDTIFGIPGIQLDPLFDALHSARDQISVVVPRHEQTTTYMADGHARVTGEPAVALVVPGPGVLNALSGLATAYACGSRVLLLAGQVATDAIGGGRGVLHEIRDQTAAESGVVRWVRRAQRPEEIAALVAEAFAFLRSPGGGPAVLELPADVLAASADYEPAGECGFPSPQATPDAILAATEAMLRAQKPMILVGGGCRSEGARSAVRALAERLNAPVVMSENGKGVVPSTHSLAFERSAYSYLRDRADAVLVVGTRGRSQSTGLPLKTPASVVRIDIDGDRLSEEQSSSIVVEGDAAQCLELMLQCMGEPQDPAAGGFDERELEGCRAHVAEHLSAIQPQIELLQAIRGAVEPGVSIIAEYTQLGYAASIALGIEEPSELIWPGYQGTLGYGFATAIGAAYRSAKPVLCITGDGGFSWTLSDLSTVAKYRIPLITIVVNDGFFGNVRRIQKEMFGERYIATDLCNPDYLKLAESFHIPAMRVQDAQGLGEAVRAAYATGEPHLIELVAAEFPSPWTIPMGD